MSCEVVPVTPEMQQAYAEWEAPFDNVPHTNAHILGAIRTAFYAGWLAHQEATLPDGLTIRDGRAEFDCAVCGAPTHWEGGELHEFRLGDPANVCGGSPRCLP